MKTIRRLIYGEVLAKVGFATLGFIGLFFFFDLVDELKWIGQGPNNAYALRHALAYVLLLVPGHAYELMPITVLIGSIFVMARFAQSSEFMILRTSGLGPYRALFTLLGLGLVFVVFTFLVGDYVSPAASRQAQLLKARYLGVTSSQGVTGAWLKESRGQNSSVVNVAAMGADGQLVGIRIFEFDDTGKLTSLMRAGLGQFEPDGGGWLLQNLERDQFQSTLESGRPQIRRETLAQWRWDNTLTEDMVSVALLKPERMATLELFNYIQHLRANGQASQRFEIDFWKKVFYPLSCLVMVILALPFAYLQLRSTPMTSMVFLGVLLGISFFLINNLFGFIGNLNAWSPWLAAATPGMVYMAGSLLAFGWLVLRH
jgi:lipopolysaccharide export system permease protein